MVRADLENDSDSDMVAMVLSASTNWLSVFKNLRNGLVENFCTNEFPASSAVSLGVGGILRIRNLAGLAGVEGYCRDVARFLEHSELHFFL